MGWADRRERSVLGAAWRRRAVAGDWEFAVNGREEPKFPLGDFLLDEGGLRF